MELQELRQKLSEAGFSEEVSMKLDKILERAIASGALSEADKTEMMELIDLDIEAGNLEADAMENMAIMLDSFVKEAEGLKEAAEVEEEKIADEAEIETDKLETELSELQKAQSVEPAAPAAPQPSFSEPIQPAPQWNIPEQPATAPAPFPEAKQE